MGIIDRRDWPFEPPPTAYATSGVKSGPWRSRPWMLSFIATRQGGREPEKFCGFFCTLDDLETALAEVRLRTALHDWQLYNWSSRTTAGHGWNHVRSSDG